ncbi:hypothetical protein DFJ58DRAFT_844067 [Suillus subalutaceus]|uniref:uncharacterized protein n=1 Tax=Suillus subalutaceus TaxID=48586 RepID=UPI001B85E002|nr:uncharacterized protein DFJ58DRAFT_844067 [Suillus subalutaceus]KAG1844159.1 hypothetical protein DFJ58DRAFT_844067 [Suillus subalutaceus]
MSEHNQSRNSRQNPPPEIRASSEATASKSSGRRHGKIRRFLGKVKNATKKISVQDASSSAEQGANPQSALQTAKEAVKLMEPLSGHVTSGASTAQNASADLDDAYDFQDTYLQPLRIFNSVIGTLADVRAIPFSWSRTNPVP